MFTIVLLGCIKNQGIGWGCISLVQPMSGMLTTSDSIPSAPKDKGQLSLLLSPLGNYFLSIFLQFPKANGNHTNYS